MRAAETNILRLQESNDHLIQHKRQLESDRDELEELRAKGGQFGSEEKRRLDAQIVRLEEELEEEQSNVELANEKLRKAQIQVAIFLITKAK